MTDISQLANPKPELIFETSWEVCNKIGGIYTVLSTKAKALQSLFKNQVIFVGPDVWTDDNPSPYFKEYGSLLKNASTALNGSLPHNIGIRVGRWLVPGNPLVVLVKFEGIYPVLDGFYARMWERYGVDSLHAYGDYPEGCAFAIASSIVISALTRHLRTNPGNVIAHFDEWTTAMGLLNLEDLEQEIATVFTTHATSIGRSICGNGKPLYDYFEGYHGDQMAYELNMRSKHSLEKNAARFADCFTTVSDVTAAECRQLLDKQPDVVTPNGFESGFVPSSNLYKAQRETTRKRLLEIAHKLTGRSFDDSDTFIVATSGRNEYRNKGIDLFIDSLRVMTESEVRTGKKILAFIMVPAWVNQAREDLKIALESGAPVDGTVNNFLTHSLHNEDTDSIAARLRNLNLNSSAQSDVTILYIPCYLDGKDGILNVRYYEMMPALDATVFPSYYEPWGYTPLESVAFGTPTVSTDKAGFGQWILSSFKNNFGACGCKIIERTDSNYNESAQAIANAVLELSNANFLETEAIRRAAQATARKADWNIFIDYYLKAFSVAFDHRDKRLNGGTELQ